MSEKPYLALYRKWRPTVFSDVIGQEHITTILRNEVETGSVSHAYLFCGSRGTGKTTCAKILARAVSCEHPQGGDPCGICPSCLAAESSFDITEMDAASNNSVEDIRSLRERVNYPPAELKRRVYIIDEVHMLSQGAFNALLKTLEEPPEHVLFILATTELHKIPATILSRCKRFDFYRIPPGAIFTRLKTIAEQEHIAADDAALMLVSRLSDGAMRDALSMLELFCGIDGPIGRDQASELLGVVGQEQTLDLLEALCKRQVEKALSLTASFYAASKDLGVLCGELGDMFRDLMVCRFLSAQAQKGTGPGDPPPTMGQAVRKAGLIDAAEDTLLRYAALAALLTPEELLFCAEQLETLQNRFSQSVFSQRVLFDMAVMRMCNPQFSDAQPALAARIAKLERRIAAIEALAPQERTPSDDSVSPSPPRRTTERADTNTGPEEQPQKPPHPSAKTHSNESENRPSLAQDGSKVPLAAFDEFLSLVKQKSMVVFSLLAGASGTISDTTVTLTVNSAAFFMLQDEAYQQVLTDCLAKLLGYDVDVAFTKEAQPVSSATDLDIFDES